MRVGARNNSDKYANINKLKGISEITTDGFSFPKLEKIVPKLV